MFLFYYFFINLKIFAQLSLTTGSRVPRRLRPDNGGSLLIDRVDKCAQGLLLQCPLLYGEKYKATFCKKLDPVHFSLASVPWASSHMGVHLITCCGMESRTGEAKVSPARMTRNLVTRTILALRSLAVWTLSNAVQPVAVVGQSLFEKCLERILRHSP
jgi:hypothetical protein